MKKDFEIYDLICLVGKGIGGISLLVIVASVILLFLIWVKGVFIPSFISIIF